MPYTKSFVAELRRLFDEERKVQWQIGDLLVRQFGSPIGESSANTGDRDEMEELGQDLGVSLATLLKYRRMAATYAPNTRVSGASYTAHEAASASADPPRVMREVAAIAKEHGVKIAPPLVREVAARYAKPLPARQSSFVERRQTVGAWGADFTSAMQSASGGLRRMRDMLAALRRDDNELDDKTARAVASTLSACEGHISWIRSFMHGGDIADESEQFLRQTGGR